MTEIQHEGNYSAGSITTSLGEGNGLITINSWYVITLDGLPQWRTTVTDCFSKQPRLDTRLYAINPGGVTSLVDYAENSIMGVPQRHKDILEDVLEELSGR